MSILARLFLAVAIVLPALSSTAAFGARAVAPWSGRLQIGDRAFVDAEGHPILPLCAHFGEAFSAWVRRPADVESQLQVIKEAGYDCIRFWDNLGEYSESWKGKEVSPFSWTNGDGIRVDATPAYYEKLQQFLARLNAIGLAAHHSRGDLGRKQPAVPLSQVIEHSKRVAAIYDAVGWHVLALYEGNNEDFQNGNFGPAGLLRIVQPVQARGAIVASSCALACSEDKGDVLRYSRGFTVRYYHGHRGGDAVDRLRRKFTSGYERAAGAPYLGWEGEPIGPKHDTGPGVSVNHTNDAEEIALLHAMTWIGGRSAATYMSQYGVYWDGPIEGQAGFRLTPRVRAALRDFAPDVMRWSLHHGARREAVLRSPDGYAEEANNTTGPARLDQAVSTDRRRVVALMYGGRGTTRLRNDMGCPASITVVGARDDEELQKDNFKLAPGESLELEYRVGRLLLGECS